MWGVKKLYVLQVLAESWSSPWNTKNVFFSSRLSVFSDVAIMINTSG